MAGCPSPVKAAGYCKLHPNGVMDCQAVVDAISSKELEVVASRDQKISYDTYCQNIEDFFNSDLESDDGE